MDKEGLINLLEPAVNALGYELVDLDFRSGRGGLIRLYIDKSPAVTLDDCECVSKQVGDLLDVEDPVGSANYVLEVSSPGLDRRLRTRAHFAAVVDAEISIELNHGIEGRKRFRGLLVRVNENEIEMRVDGRDWQLPLADLRSARLVPSD